VPVVTQEAEAGRSLELSGVVCVRVGGGGSAILIFISSPLPQS
jgi:hypothetical protein